MSFQASKVVAVTPAASDLANGICGAVLASAAMTATIVDATGTTVSNVALIAGYNPIRCKQIVSVSAGSVWALY